MDIDDWRYHEQETYLLGVALRRKKYAERITKTDHDHCEFCGAKFSDSIEALLAPDTMSTAVKISLNITRKQSLLLSKVIERGLSVQQEDGQVGILSIVDGAELAKLQGLSADLLKKAGLTEMIDKLNSLSTK
jgi:hypothetical protein